MFSCAIKSASVDIPSTSRYHRCIRNRKNFASQTNKKAQEHFGQAKNYVKQKFRNVHIMTKQSRLMKSRNYHTVMVIIPTLSYRRDKQHNTNAQTEIIVWVVIEPNVQVFLCMWEEPSAPGGKHTNTEHANPTHKKNKWTSKCDREIHLF